VTVRRLTHEESAARARVISAAAGACRRRSAHPRRHRRARSASPLVSLLSRKPASAGSRTHAPARRPPRLPPLPRQPSLLSPAPEVAHTRTHARQRATSLPPRLPPPALPRQAPSLATPQRRKPRAHTRASGRLRCRRFARVAASPPSTAVCRSTKAAVVLRSHAFPACVSRPPLGIDHHHLRS